MSARFGLSSLVILCGLSANTAWAQSVETPDPPTPRAVAPTAAPKVAMVETASNQRIQALIEQLGANSFEEREAASAALLKIGEPALLALSAAERGTDLEISGRASAVRQRIEQDQFEAISVSFKRDPDPAASYGLPGWKSFSNVAGASRPAKRLFLKMLERRRIVALCLEAIDGGHVAPGLFDGLPDDPQARLRAVMAKTCSDIRFGLMSGRDEAVAGDLVALLVAQQYMDESMQDVHEAIRMECARGGLDRLMTMPGAGTAARKTVGSWFRRAPLVYASDIFTLARIYRIPDASYMARRILQEDVEAIVKTEALITLSNFGNLDDLPLIDKYVENAKITDEFLPSSSFDIRIDRQAPPNTQPLGLGRDQIMYQQTLGDVAVAAGGKLLGMDLVTMFPAIMLQDGVGINLKSVGFPLGDKELRAKSKKAYQERRGQNVPPAS